MRPTVPLVAMLALAALIATGCGGSATKIGGPTTTANGAGFSGAALSKPRPAQPIALRDATDGAPVTLAGQRGRFVLVTFLYTHCPDVCPLIAANLNAALRTIGPARSRVRVLAVSVDPTGDTVAAVRAYRTRMHLLPQFRYLIGTRVELRRVWLAWHVLSVQRKPDLVDHVAYTALIDPAGRERVLYDSTVHARQVVHDLRLLMQATRR